MAFQVACNMENVSDLRFYLEMLGYIAEPESSRPKKGKKKEPPDKEGVKLLINVPEDAQETEEMKEAVGPILAEYGGSIIE